MFFRLCVCWMICFSSVLADEWPQWRGSLRDGVWRETGVVETLTNVDVKWRVPISSGYSGPTVVDGRVYVTDRMIKPKQIERVHCFEWETGKTIWSYEYDCEYRNVGYGAGPRASVTVQDGLAYALGAMGNLHCFDAVSGEVKWQKDLNTEYQIQMPIWGIASAPLIEGDLLIVQAGGEGACVVAFDRVTGEERWRALDDQASYSAPLVIDQMGKRVLVCWTGASVTGLNPETGMVYWTHSWEPTRMVLSVATPVLYEDMLFFTGFYDGALLLKLHQDKLAVEPVWFRRGESERKTEAIQSIISTPVILDGYIYGVDSYGELRCLDLMTGDRVWEDLTAVPKARWATIHFTPHEDRVWMFNERGELLSTKLSPLGLNVMSRVQLIAPTTGQLNRRGGVCWAHPAYAYQHIFVRNDEELICVTMAP
ncbi:MAG: PQQ-like beta-propeller repeat protein [Candidatus Latescibacteria bacterium]|jgi:outer membrane protein assembly factor BamB|nr:PQQ-like beta-propeller repeat protein [Candidatus Latescibacterota bacterium]MBT4141052.1 PQQ-like beta-propeller repeat protein [Candidatus Latescibacterota bacterium]